MTAPDQTGQPMPAGASPEEEWKMGEDRRTDVGVVTMRLHVSAARALDAARALSLPFGRHWRRAGEARYYA